ncbi:hypothetical protein OPT61_g8187 [Boeremia exigua]|uniref:Uncharacterized protein n=1 Tax=Boeremia exigua TaxID=749465 RepID=A0ACC2HZN9_9PLEO|nr:hypothetical protein OPT61_g8187 [Boeremia exigua]
MPSFSKMMKQLSGSTSRSDDKSVWIQDSERSRAVWSSASSAACRGLYDAPSRRDSRQSQRVGGNRRSTGSDNSSDPITKFSVYPQMVGKRRSQLEAEARTRSMKSSPGMTETDRREGTTPPDRPAHQKQLSSRVRPRSINTEFSLDSGHSSDGNPEGRPVRVCMYPQAKYIKEPVEAPLKSEQASVVYPSETSSKNSSVQTLSSQVSKRSSLPSDEHQLLVRRQRLQRAREMLELHYTHHGLVRGGHIRHGEMQGFTIRNSERRRISKLRYAVRKALQSDLDLQDADFKLAMNRYADRVYFCELSDVDGRPIDEQMIEEFIGLYQKARDAAQAARLLSSPRSHPTRTWVDVRNRRVHQAALALAQADGAVAMEVPVRRPRLVSKFSWDSNDGEVASRKRLTKMQW